jgi:hypothetical protein
LAPKKLWPEADWQCLTRLLSFHIVIVPAEDEAHTVCTLLSHVGLGTEGSQLLKPFGLHQE